MSASAAAPRAGSRPGDPGDRSRGGRWFLEFLIRELEPYPGRVSTVARMVAATTLAMLLLMSFHLPGGALGGFFALITSRESLRNTVQNAWLTIAVFCLGTVYVLAGVAMFVDSPVTHFFWVIGSLYLIFFVMSTGRNYQLAAGFSFLIATAIPIWDREGGVNLKIALTLYTLLSVVIGTLSTLFVELIYRSFHPQDPVILGIADRLLVAGEVLRSFAEGKPLSRPVEARVLQYAMVGPSSLRQQLIRAGQSPEIRARASAAAAISARLVELCAAALGQSETTQPSGKEAERLRALATVLEEQAKRMRALPDVAAIGRSSLPRWSGSEAPSRYLPILPEIERSTSLLSDIFNSFGVRLEQDAAAHTNAGGAFAARERLRALGELLGANPRNAFVSDAFSNRAHLVFAMRGCLAASSCYVIYNAVDWPGINTSVATCIITALGTIGSSRQKQLLRLSGAFAGGFLVSLPAQVYLLPQMDSIAAFTLFFAVVSGIAAWFATSSPRLAYFGLQLALAFYLVNLQEPFEQISLSIARDRVIGVLLGLVMMWIVFDRIASQSAIERMDTLLRGNLRMLGDLACTVADGQRGARGEVLGRFRQLRDKINENFSQMNAQADAVQFEFGRDRARQLRERERMQSMQPAMRSLFLLEIALWEAEEVTSARNAASGRGPALQPSLQRLMICLREALYSLALLPVPAKRASQPYVGSQEQADAAIRSVQGELARVQGEPEQGRETLLPLCSSLVVSLGALQRAANTP